MPAKSTVLLLSLNVPPDESQLPLTVMVELLALNVPSISTFPVTDKSLSVVPSLVVKVPAVEVKLPATARLDVGSLNVSVAPSVEFTVK